MEEEKTPDQVADPVERLADALRTRVASAPGDERAARADALRRHVELYVLPRAANLDAPLLVVILGSTGSGKSSLLNALAGARLSPAGVLRPTTRQPIAIAHPDELRGAIGAIARKAGWEVRIHPQARRGMVIVDAPDFDSIEADNRERALGLLEIADLVIFLTTATRYADQVPWEVLSRARARGVPLLAVLNRLPPEAEDADAVVADYRALLERGKLGENLELVAIGEGAVHPEHDALGADAIAGVRDVLDRLVASREERRELARRGLSNALEGIPNAIEAIAAQVDEEQEAVVALRRAAEQSYAQARRSLREDVAAGTFLRAEVLRQWQDFIGAGQIARFLADGIGKVRATISSLIRPTPEAPATEVRAAAFADLTALAVQHADTAAQRTAAQWAEDRYGALALEADARLWRASPDMSARLSADLEAWGRMIGERIRTMGSRRKGFAKVASVGVNAVGTSAVLAVFVSTGGLTGTELGITAATAVLNQKLLEAIFGEANVAAFVSRARKDLESLLDAEYTRELGRFAAALGSAGNPTLAGELREAARDVSRMVPS
ncbi:MAG: GTPase domain-containing protein [Chloroflexi bacterium]|nr:GTPase domain-containing protein [Chloroflexota bacterium]